MSKYHGHVCPLAEQFLQAAIADIVIGADDDSVMQ